MMCSECLPVALKVVLFSQTGRAKTVCMCRQHTFFEGNLVNLIQCDAGTHQFFHTQCLFILMLYIAVFTPAGLPVNYSLSGFSRASEARGSLAKPPLLILSGLNTTQHLPAALSMSSHAPASLPSNGFTLPYNPFTPQCSEYPFCCLSL